MSEAWEERQKARRVLGAAVAEAEGKPNEIVFALPVMRRAGVSNVEFRRAAHYLDEQGWIAESRGEYETFVLTPEGVDWVTGGRDEVPRTERPRPDNGGGEDKEDADSDEDGDEDDDDDGASDKEDREDD
jgi:hypothetical protein